MADEGERLLARFGTHCAHLRPVAYVDNDLVYRWLHLFEMNQYDKRKIL